MLRVGGLKRVSLVARACTTDARVSATEKLKQQTVDEVEAQARARRVQSKEEDAAAAKDEIGGPKGAEPTRYGDWERKGRVSDF
jgi:hypothetical protein